MKIYSWNMLYRNQKLQDAFRFIAKSEFDIFCLQEVPEEILARLKILPFHLAYRVDTEKVFPTSIVPMYNVILSHHPIQGEGEVSFDDYWPLLPVRTRFFLHFMPAQLFSKIRNRGGIYADISIAGKSVRVFCLHLILANPLWRLQEFERAMLKRDHTRPTIVCGDFNILEARHITPLNWVLGGHIADALLHRRERLTIEKRFVEHDLQNALRHTITHPLSRSQLDHILVSNNFSIKRAEVLPDRVGSDHNPICVEIE